MATIIAHRFWAKVDKAGDCWLWTGPRFPNGYGLFSVGSPPKRRRNIASRVAYELANGPIPAARLVCHHCDNKACVRPSHLFVGTQADNMRDASSKGLMKGAKPGKLPSHVKLTPQEVQAIRRLYAGGRLSQRQVGSRFGIGQGHVGQIVRGTMWQRAESRQTH